MGTPFLYMEGISNIKNEEELIMMEFIKTYSIGEASRHTGASIKSIRYWESRGYVPKADRVVCGEKSYRRFKKTDLEIIHRIKKYLGDGFTLAVAAEKAAKENLINGGR